MKKIVSFLALILCSAMTFAAVSITVSPNNVDFGEVSIKGKSVVEDSVIINVTYSGLQAYCGVIFEDDVMPDDHAFFWLSGTKTDGWIYGGDQYNPAEGQGLKLHYYADAAGTYTGKIRFYSYADADWEIESESVYLTIKLTVTDDAIVAKTIPFERIESTSGLKDGDTIVFVCESASEVSGPLDGAALSTVSATFKDGKAEVPEEGVQMFKVKSYGGGWQFYTADAEAKRLHLDIESNSAKGAFTYADTKANAIFATWGVEITNGDAVVSRNNDEQEYPVRWVSGGTGGRFKPYKNLTGSDIALYKKSGSASELTTSFEIGAVNFGTVELDEQKEVVVNYTAENLTEDIMWEITGADKALFSVTPELSTNRTSGSVTVKYLGTAAAVKTIDAKLYALTQDIALDDLEREIPISITLAEGTVKLTKIEFNGAPTTIDQGQSIDLSPFVVYTPNDAADKSLTWATDHDYQGTITAAGVLTAKKVTGNIVVTATSVKVPSVSATHTLTITVPTITDFTLSDTEATLVIGETKQLSITAVVPEYATASATYASSNTDVATVNKNGVITAKAEGTADITVTVGEVNKVCKVTVNKVEVTSVTFEPDTKELAVGATFQLVPVVSPAAAASQYTAAYESGNTAVATVSETGLVTAVAEGTAVITVTIGGKSADMTITVVGAKFFTKVTDVATLKAKDTIILAVKGMNGETPYAIVAGARNTTKKGLTVVSSGVTITDAAAASENALQFVLGAATGGFTLTPLGAAKAIAIGTSNDIVDATASNNSVWEFVADASNGIYVHNTGTNTGGNGYLKYHFSNDIIKAYKATTTGATYVYVYVRPYQEPVKPAATAIKLDKTELTFHVGDGDVTLKATVTPSDADQTVLWESSNTAIATVSATGKVHAVAKGEATITAKVKSNESLTATCTVTVEEWVVESVAFDDEEEETIEVGESITVSATAYPTGHGFVVDYYTSDAGVATVTIGGKVTGVAVGDVTITAKSGDKEATKAIHVVAKPDDPTAIDQLVNGPSSSGKLIKEGHILIIREDKVYNLLGGRVE